jgi:hypothetical protein
MATYHQGVLRDSQGEYLARVNPSDYGHNVKSGAGDQFDTEVLPVVMAAAEAHFGRRLTPIWVDDMSCDGWNSDPSISAPWDGPASLYDEPDLPDLVSVSRGLQHPRQDQITLTSL